MSQITRSLGNMVIFLYLTHFPHFFLNPDSLSKNLDPPVFIEPLEDSCVDEGGDIELRGVLTGSQPIKVTWLQNGEENKILKRGVFFCIHAYYLTCSRQIKPHNRTLKAFFFYYISTLLCF